MCRYISLRTNALARRTTLSSAKYGANCSERQKYAYTFAARDNETKRWTVILKLLEYCS